MALTPAHRRVLILAANGLQGEEAAARLSISNHTLINHQKALRGRLRARTMPHAVAIAFCDGLLTCEDIARET